MDVECCHSGAAFSAPLLLMLWCETSNLLDLADEGAIDAYVVAIINSELAPYVLPVAFHGRGTEQLQITRSEEDG